MSFQTVEIKSELGATRASFVPLAGMVCCSWEHRGEELLDRGRGLEAYAAQGKTMGIPLLYPWANRLAHPDYEVAGRRIQLPNDPARIPRDPNGLPIHGVLPGLMRWEATGSGSRISARLRWEEEQLLTLFPFRHEVRIDAVVGEGELRIITTVIAGAGEPVPVSFGYHPYLRLPDRPRQACRVALPGCERLVLDERSIPTGAREPLGPTAFRLEQTSWDDGLVLSGQPARFTVSAGERERELELVDGFPYGQVYAPPEHDYICFEPMTALTNALRSGEDLSMLAPGQQHRAEFRIAVRDG